MGFDTILRALFGKREPAPVIGPQTESGAVILGKLHAKAAGAFGVSAVELTEMWKHEIRLDRTMGKLAAGVDALADASSGAARDFWLVSKPGDTQVLGVIGRYAESGKHPTWVASDTQGRLTWRSNGSSPAVMQRGGWPDV